MNSSGILLMMLGLISLPFDGFGQAFVNGDMNGSVGLVSVPASWIQVPFTDPISQADQSASATVDILDPTGPSAGGGIAGNPSSGTTFCSGLHAESGTGLLWHEGIQQVVSGFTIGTTYAVSFDQSVVKQGNCLDESGSWRMYIDGVLIGTSAVSTSSLSAFDINIAWDNRVMNFTASATSHNFQFIPFDDDANILTSGADITGALRMGIDDIMFVAPLPIELISFEGETTSGGNKLIWSTASEHNNDYFVVERSNDLESWVSLGRIDGAGYSNSTLEYSLFDRNNSRNTTYYQLVQVDFDGTKTASYTITILDHGINEVILSPNPAIDFLLISSKESITAIRILDLRGAEIMSLKYIVKGQTYVDVSNLQTGMYIVEVSTTFGITTERVEIR